MIELVFTACTILGSCHNERLQFAEPSVNVFQCMRYGQSALAQWSNDHPGHLIKHWRCQKSGLTAKA
jgi:hypothetical protein